MQAHKLLIATVSLAAVSVHSSATAGWVDGENPPAPPAEARLSTDSRGFASGNFTAVLSKGGPTGFFVWGHLHGKHKGRTGSTRYGRIGIMVLGEYGWPYFIGEQTTLTIGADPGKPDVNKHKTFFAKIEGDNLSDLKTAIKNDVKMRVLAGGERDRASFGEELVKTLGDAFKNGDAREAVLSYFSGSMSKNEAMKKLKESAKGPDRG